MVVLNSRVRFGLDSDISRRQSTAPSAFMRSRGRAPENREDDVEVHGVGQGVLITREQVVFPDGGEVVSVVDQKGSPTIDIFHAI